MSHERFPVALEPLATMSPEAIVAIDVRGLVEFWSSAAAALFGWSEEELLGKPLPVSIGTVRAANFEPAVPVAAKDGTPLNPDFKLSALPSGCILP